MQGAYRLVEFCGDIGPELNALQPVVTDFFLISSPYFFYFCLMIKLMLLVLIPDLFTILYIYCLNW